MEGSANERLDFWKMGYRCKIRAPCCNETFDCRHCHNESTSMLSSPFDRHELVRSDVKQVICSVCDTEQPVVRVCTNCGVNMGEYFCEVCKFYDDDCAQMFEFFLRHVGVLRQVGVFRKKGTKLYEASLKDEKPLDQ